MIWNIDSANSRVSFAIRLLSVSTTRGRFTALRGQLHIDEQNPANSWVAAQVDAASIDTRNRLRDAHLRTARFFAVKDYPTISFRSTQVEHIGGQHYRVTGDLTLRGITKPVTFDVEYRGHTPITDTRSKFVAKAEINRLDFGLGQGGGVQLVASPMVAIEVELEAVQPSVEARETVGSISSIKIDKLVCYTGTGDQFKR